MVTTLADTRVVGQSAPNVELGCAMTHMRSPLPFEIFANNSCALARMMSAKPCRILIVDDNADIAESTALLCRLDGHEAEALSDGERALEFARRYRPDVIVLDLVLHGSRLDGFQLALRFRSDEELASVSLVANTGLSRPTDRERALRAGFEHFFTKPADPDELLTLIDEVLCRRRGRQPAIRQVLQ